MYRRRAPQRRAAPRRRTQPAAARRPYANRGRARPAMRRRGVAAPYRRRAVRQRRAVPSRRATMHASNARMKSVHDGIYLDKFEFIGSVIPSTTAGLYTTQVFPLNIGLNSTFPFGSAIAANYQEWDPVSMEVIYRTTSGNSISNTNNSSLGTVAMAVQYNSYTAIPTSKQVLENLQGAVSGPPSKSMKMKVQCKSGRNPLNTYYVRTTAAVPAGSTLQMTDIGNLIVATAGLPVSSGASEVGEIWIRYRVHLKAAVSMGGQIGNTINTALYHYSTAVSAVVPTSGNFWGGAGTTTFSAAGVSNGLIASSQNTMPLLFSSTGTASAFQWPANIVTGNYLVIIRFTQGSTASAAATVPTFTNCQGDVIWTNGNSSAYAGIGTNTTICLVWAVTLGPQYNSSPQVPSSISFSNGITFGTVTTMDICVSQMNGGITTST